MISRLPKCLEQLIKRYFLSFVNIVCLHVHVASFPGPTSQTIGKAGGGPGTFWHVTDVKLRRHGRGFPLAKRCTNARLRDCAQKSERRRVLARRPSWSLYLPLAKTRRLSDFCARSRSRALVQRFANGKPRPCRRNLTSVTCQNVPGPPPAFPIVWEVGPGNEANVHVR